MENVRVNCKGQVESWEKWPMKRRHRQSLSRLSTADWVCLEYLFLLDLQKVMNQNFLISYGQFLFFKFTMAKVKVKIKPLVAKNTHGECSIQRTSPNSMPGDDSEHFLTVLIETGVYSLMSLFLCLFKKISSTLNVWQGNYNFKKAPSLPLDILTHKWMCTHILPAGQATYSSSKGPASISCSHQRMNYVNSLRIIYKHTYSKPHVYNVIQSHKVSPPQEKSSTKTRRKDTVLQPRTHLVPLQSHSQLLVNNNRHHRLCSDLYINDHMPCSPLYWLSLWSTILNSTCTW